MIRQTEPKLKEAFGIIIPVGHNSKLVKVFEEFEAQCQHRAQDPTVAVVSIQELLIKEQTAENGAFTWTDEELKAMTGNKSLEEFEKECFRKAQAKWQGLLKSIQILEESPMVKLCDVKAASASAANPRIIKLEKKHEAEDPEITKLQQRINALEQKLKMTTSPPKPKKTRKEILKSMTDRQLLMLLVNQVQKLHKHIHEDNAGACKEFLSRE